MVERTRAWFNRLRRLRDRDERHADIDAAFLSLAPAPVLRTGMLASVAARSMTSCRWAPATATPTGTPRASVSTLRFVPCLPRSAGLRPAVFPPGGAFVIAPSAASRLQSIPSSASYAVSPRRQSSRNTPAARHSWKRRCAEDDAQSPVAESAFQERVPLAAGAQAEEDGVHGPAVVHARVVAPERVRLARGQQGRDLGPERVGRVPSAPDVTGRAGRRHTASSTASAHQPAYLTPAYWDRLLGPHVP
jgi:hypothetical protein